jgi:hypothetical protein
MAELDEALVVTRAKYELYLGTEPEEIGAALLALARFDLGHPILEPLAARLRGAHAIKTMLSGLVSGSRGTPTQQLSR